MGAYHSLANFLQALSSWSVNQWVAVALRKGAHVHVPLNLEVALVAPGGSPAVLHVPELLSIFGSVSGRQHGVVDVLGGLSAIIDAVDTAGIVLEAGDDLEGDAHGACNEQPLCEFLFVTLGDVVAAVLDVGGSLLGSVHAGAVLGGVGVGLVAFEAVGILDVLECLRRKPTFAAEVVELACTVDQLLLGEREVLALAEDIPVALNGSDSGESPAAAAASLVLHGSDHSEVVPLEGLGCAQLSELLADLEVVGGGAVLGSHEPQVEELVEGEVGVVVDALLPGGLLDVVPNDFSERVVKDLEVGLALGGVDALELGVDLASGLLAELGPAVQEVPVLDVQVQIAAGEDQQSHDENERFHKKLYGHTQAAHLQKEFMNLPR